MSPRAARPQTRGRADRPRPDRALPHGVHLGRGDGRASRPPSAATSSRTRTSSSPAGCRCSGADYYTLKAEFQTAQAVTPGQGQAVTIAGAKIGEVAQRRPAQRASRSVTMRVTPKYAHFYRNATMLLRPKTQLQDITVEVNPGTPSAGQAAERCDDPALADRAERQLRRIPLRPGRRNARLPAGAAGRRRRRLQEQRQGVLGDAQALRPDRARRCKRSPPNSQQRHANIARSIHNFRLLMEALGGKDKQLAQLVDASNAVFATFAKEDSERPERRCSCCPARCTRPAAASASSATAAHVLGPTLHKLEPFAKALGPANEATRKLAITTTPIIKNEIRPFAREILPTVNELAPDTKELAEAFPKLATSFARAQRILQRARLQPGQEQGRLRVLPRLGQPQPQQRRQLRRRATARSAAPRLLQLRSRCRSSKASPKSTRTSTCWSGCCSPPTEAECQRAGMLKGASAVHSARQRARRRSRQACSRASAARSAQAPPSKRHGQGDTRAAREGALSMQKRAPTLGNILVIILFVLSCFGLLLFLWESFGGPLPLKPKGYRMTVAFPRTLALAEQSDVRISGVDVGHVVVGRSSATAGAPTRRSKSTSKYAPIRANMHAILRQKTLLGETYVQLIPEGNGRTGPFVPDNGQLADSQVEPSVTLDDILSAFDPKTAPRLPDLAAGGRRRHQRPRRTDQRRLRRSSNRSCEHANKLVGDPRLPGRGGARAGQEHGRRVQRARQPRPSARRADRQRRTHLPRRRRRQPGVRRGLPRAAGVRAQLAKRR